MTRTHPLLYPVSVFAGTYFGVFSLGLAYMARAWLFASLWPFIVLALAVPPLAISLTVTVFVCAKLAARIRKGAGDTVLPPPTMPPPGLLSVFMASTEKTPSTHDRELWNAAYERLARITRQYGGSLANRKIEPHFERRKRLYYDHMVGEFVRTEQVERRGPKGEYFLIDWFSTERKIHHGVITLAPCPDQEPPELLVYLPVVNTDTRTRSANTGTVEVSPSGAVVRGVAQ